MQPTNTANTDKQQNAPTTAGTTEAPAPVRRKSPANDKRNTDRALAGMSEANRATMTRYLRVREVEGLKRGSLYNYAATAAALDAHVAGTDLRDVTPDDVLDHLAAERQRISDATIVCRIRLLKRLLKDLNGWHVVPPEFEQVLKTRLPRPSKRSNIVDEQQLKQILRAAEQIKTSAWDSPCERLQALALTLWDTGFRISEALSLKVKDLDFDDHGVTLALDPASPDLKTGARTIHAVQCSHALKVWLSLHPEGTNPDAPVFITSRRQSPPRAMTPQAAFAVVGRLAMLAGVALNGTKPLSPHDFRHSAATRKAKAGWMEQELRAYFGWSEGSNMPARYVHLSKGDMRERVRRDAGVDDSGFKQAMEAGDQTRALAELLQSVLRQAPPAQAQTVGSEWLKP